MKKSKYYYDYTRNMSAEQEMNFFQNNNCKYNTCLKETCDCCRGLPECPWNECLCRKDASLWDRIKEIVYAWFKKN